MKKSDRRKWSTYLGCLTEALKTVVVIGAVIAVLIIAAWYAGGLQ